MIIQNWGHKDYSEVNQLQLKAWQEVVTNPLTPQILFGTHPEVITLGLRGSLADLQDTKAYSKKLPIVNCDRGGQATLHSEGQLVIYPIFALEPLQLTIKELVCLLEKSTKKTLRSFGVEVLECNEIGQSGVFTPMGKIMSLGLRVQSGVTRHGLAINISNDLSLFNSIRVCGVSSRKMDKLEHWCEGIKVEDFFSSWIDVLVEDLTSRSPYSNFTEHSANCKRSVGAVGSAFP